MEIKTLLLTVLEKPQEEEEVRDISSLTDSFFPLVQRKKAAKSEKRSKSKT